MVNNFFITIKKHSKEIFSNKIQLQPHLQFIKGHKAVPQRKFHNIFTLKGFLSDQLEITAVKQFNLQDIECLTFRGIHVYNYNYR